MAARCIKCKKEFNRSTKLQEEKLYCPNCLEKPKEQEDRTLSGQLKQIKGNRHGR